MCICGMNRFTCCDGNNRCATGGAYACYKISTPQETHGGSHYYPDMHIALTSKSNKHHADKNTDLNTYHIIACFIIWNLECNENRWQTIFALAEIILHLTLKLWGAWLARQQILQSVSHGCVSIVQISLLIPPSRQLAAHYILPLWLLNPNRRCLNGL